MRLITFVETTDRSVGDSLEDADDAGATERGIQAFSSFRVIGGAFGSPPLTAWSKEEVAQIQATIVKIKAAQPTIDAKVTTSTHEPFG